MSIKDLTDKPRARLPRLGQLRKGGKKTDPKKPGPDLTYFRFVSGDPSIVKAFDEAYDKEPRVINVLLPYPVLEENLSTWREEHGAGSLKHRCDGEIMVLWQDENGVFQTEPKPCPYKDLPKGDPGRKCTETGELHVIIPELGRWGYIQVVTGSIWDCLELTDNLVAIEELAQRVSIMTGRPINMQGIPCLLKREPRMISTPNGNKPRVRREKWLLHLEVHPEYMKRLAEMSQQFALPVVETPQLEAPDLELDYNPGDVNGDVEYPETEVLDDSPEPVAEPQAQTNGSKAERPLEPEQLRKFLRQRAGNDQTPATKKQVPFVASKFAEAFAPDEDATQKYHSALKWLWEVDSAKGLTKGKAKATLDWLLSPDGPDDSGDTPLHQHAPEEARRVLRVALQEAGQQELPLEA